MSNDASPAGAATLPTAPSDLAMPERRPGPLASGRSPRALVPVSIAPGAAVVHLPLGQILEHDTTYLFRARIRVADLRASIAREGQQMPVIVRRVERDGAAAYQLISGFRRYAAIKSLGWPSIAAVVREDIEDDEAAFRASIAENIARKSYSDIDRAIVIRSYRDQGHKAADVSQLMGMTDRGRKMVESLLKMPQVVQDAVDDPDHRFKTKHAVLIWRLKGEYPTLDVAEWIERVAEEDLSVEKMVRRVNDAFRGSARKPSGFSSLFQDRGTDFGAGEIWFAPTKVRIADLSDDERRALRDDLERVLAIL